MSAISLSGNHWEQKVKWYHGVAFFVLMHVLAAPWIQTPEYLNTQVKAPFAPPDWAFGPIWFLNTALMVYAGMLLLRKPVDAPNRQTLIILQIISWACFLIFGWTYFGLHSTILGSSITLIMFVVNLVSVILGFKLDKRFSYTLIPLLVWLSVAAPVAVYQALYNHDELLRVGPFLS
ncbi:MAG: tryptophan-rich sensory protein [Rhizobacter sp.]|nr:tryptophan-rich sensory protein [Chlorobiales bacterium]